jgi:hypothetical protein
MLATWLDYAGFAAAGGIGGLLYWTIADRDVIVTRLKALLRAR